MDDSIIIDIIIIIIDIIIIIIIIGIIIGMVMSTHLQHVWSEAWAKVHRMAIRELSTVWVRLNPTSECTQVILTQQLQVLGHLIGLATRPVHKWHLQQT